jgi:glyoxylase-like metal-dependent hydrolase (beta-lactamase superfamily II)
MRVHAIQTGTVAVRTRQRQGAGNGLARRINTLRDPEWTEPLPILAWVIEHPEGVIVVDTGETAGAARKGYFPSWHPYFRLGVREWVEPEQEIGPQLRALGMDPDDVRWVVTTHLHTDHAGGLAHFPHSEIVVARQELAAATGFAGKVRGYLPHRWPGWFVPTPVELAGLPFGPFPASHPLTAAGDVRLVPTFGHSAGHLSVVVQEDDQDLFIAGDASYTEQLMLDQAIDGVAPDEQAARITLQRILRYVSERPTVYLPSHDPRSSTRLTLRQRTHQFIIS